LASRHLQTRAEMLFAIANLPGGTPAEEAAKQLMQGEADAATNTKGLGLASRLLLNILRRASVFLVRIGSKLSGSARIRAVALRVAFCSLRHASRMSPDDFSVWLALGQIYLKRGQGAKAILALQKATQLAPLSSEAWAFLARAYASRDR